MFIKELSAGDFPDVYENYMTRDFPQEELKPLKRILYTMEKGFCRSFALYQGAALFAYAVCIIPEKTKHLLLDYYAVVEGERGKGTGRFFFGRLQEYLEENFPRKQGMFIECESVESAVSEEAKRTRNRRIEFYKSCGCAVTGMEAELFGVHYRVLYTAFSGQKEAPVHRKDLDGIYKTMFQKKHYRERVALWERLDDGLFSMEARKMAPFLLGKRLCRKVDGVVMKYRITETECYCGEQDTACHAFHGKTQRTKPLYEKGGTSYIYLCYGIHCLFNVVSGKEGKPEAVLIRGVEGYNGPGKLTKAMKIDLSLNEIDLAVSDELWIEDDGVKFPYTRDKRVGIDYATKRYRDALWRFIAKG